MRTVCLVISCLALASAAASKSSEDTWSELTVIPTAKAYALTITVSSKRWSGTNAEIFVRLEGADGTKTEWESIGSDWKTDGMQADKSIPYGSGVGQLKKLYLKSKGSNAVRFESINVADPDGDSVSFPTSAVSLKCKKKSWFNTDNAQCIAIFDAAAAAGSESYDSVDYEFVVTLKDRRNSNSDAKIYAAIKGAAPDGAVPVTKYKQINAEGFWTKDKMGKPVTLKVNLRDVGPPTALLLKSDSNDAVVFESITVAAPGMNATYFSTGSKSVKCKNNAWFKSNNAACIEEYSVGVKPGEEGEVICPERPSAAPITSDFTKPTSSQDLTYGSDRFNFTVRLDCSHRGAYRFEYHAAADCGKLERRSGFSLDPQVDKKCQQKNGKAYPTTEGVSFDRGHLVPANHMDSDKIAIYQSNYMTNILPQAAQMNRGAWLQSEELVECYREQEDLYVLGGAVYDPTYDRYSWFKKSHYVDNPSFYWKIIKGQTIYPETGNMLALWMPNSEDAKRDQINKYVVSITELEKNLKKYGQEQTFDIEQTVKDIVPTAAWDVPKGCDRQL